MCFFCLTFSQVLAKSLCPQGFILVPADKEYLVRDYCVAKYEMKMIRGKLVSKAEGVPFSDISRNTAINLCKKLGKKYNLIGNDEYQNLARNIESVAENWSSNIVGKGQINRGLSGDENEESPASDDNHPCYLTKGKCKKIDWSLYKRTHKLSNDELIWDLAGNAWEYIRENYSDLKLEVDIPIGRYDFDNPKLFPRNGSGRNHHLFAPKSPHMKRINGVGHIGTADFDSSKMKVDEVVVRGGHHDSKEKAGIFTILRTPVTPTMKDIGSIRCIYYP